MNSERPPSLRQILAAAAAPSRWVLSNSRSHLPQLYFPDVLVTAMHEVVAIRIFDDLNPQVEPCDHQPAAAEVELQVIAPESPADEIVGSVTVRYF
jgi:hypothetical protein